MIAFTQLFENLENTNSTLAKVEALSNYFASVSAKDAIWALYFLSGRKLKRILPTKQLRELIMQSTGMLPWLFEECYAHVGDLAETIALLLEERAGANSLPLHEWIERIGRLPKMSKEEQLVQLKAWWAELGTREIFLLNKLLTGGFRAGVSHTLVVRALAKVATIPEPVMSQRLMGNWEPTHTFYQQLISPDRTQSDPGSPYPFYLASPLGDEVTSLGEAQDWLVEWKWDGIRCQCLRRGEHVFLWSRGEELITDRFPEITAAVRQFPPCVLDGEILAFADSKVLPFAALQQRIGRLKLTPKILETIPVVFMAFDLLEENGEDLREKPLSERRRRLETLLQKNPSSQFKLSTPILAKSWQEFATIRETARGEKVEGLMIKRMDSVYKTGRKRGDWWKWKVDPFTMDAVLLYAHPGHGRRATLYTDYTFAVWSGTNLVPVAKAYSGLTDVEINQLDRWIRNNTVERFGPVRSVKPTEVFELAFEGILPSPRHKSGVAVRFPRILRKRDDKPAEQADTLDRLKELIRATA